MQKHLVTEEQLSQQKMTLQGIVLRSLLSVGLLAVGFGSLFLFYIMRPVPQRDPKDNTRTVEVAAATVHTDGVGFSVDGLVVPYRELQIAAEVPGRVVYKSDACRVGRTVHQGDVLMRIDPRDYEFEVRRFEEELEQSHNNVVELQVQIESAANHIELAKEDLELQQRELTRLEKITRDGIVSDSDLDETRRAVLMSRITLQRQKDEFRLFSASKLRLESGTERMETQLAKAQVDLKRAEIIAPIDGVITEEHVEQDGFVQKGAMLCVIRDASRLDVRCSLQTDQMNWLWASQDANETQSAADAYAFPETPVTVVYTMGDEEFAWDGVLARYDGGGIDAQTRMVPCRVHVENPLGVRRLSELEAPLRTRPPTLMVGMFTQVRIKIVPKVALLQIPTTALQPGSRVWVVEEGKLAPRKVSIADTEPGSVLIYERASSLAAGEQVVISPLASPVAGAAVEVRGTP